MASAACLRCTLSDRAGSGRVGLVGVAAGENSVRVPDSAGSSGPEGGAAASVRAALYPGEEAPRRHPVTPGLAGPSGLPLRHSLSPARRPTIATDLPADRHQSTQLASKRASDLCLLCPDNNKHPQGSAPRLRMAGFGCRGRELREPLGTLPAAQSCLLCLLAAVPVRHSLQRPSPSSFLALIGCSPWPLACSAPSGCLGSQDGLVELAAWVGPDYPASDGATSRRVLGAASSSRQAGG